MIPVASGLTQTDTLPGDEIAFSIGDPRWVMRTQADLYSNRELAVTREYSTNARDAMLEAGKADQPIEVTLPSVMHPYFRVRDFGDGMSRETMGNVYTKFGSSTKRDSNLSNGMLGYGCKSAVAYTDTFTVISIRDGIRTVAVINRKPDWSIVMKILEESPSTEASGTEVTVPVYNAGEFAQKAMDFYKFWLPGTVMVNGSFPAHEVGDKITDGLYYSTHWNTSYVVMGNVPYRVTNPQALFTNVKMNAINFVAYVDNGDVEFTPSREDLKYTEHTKQTLHKVIRDFESKIVDAANKDIAAADDHFDAYSRYMKWSNNLGKAMFSELKYDGDLLEETFKISGVRYATSGYYGYSVQNINQWQISEMFKTLIVTEFEPSLSSHHKKQVREYIGHAGIKASYILFTADSNIDSVWVDKSRIITWEALKAALPKKAPKARVYQSGPKRIKGTFDYWTKDGWRGEQEIPENKTVYYVRVQDEKPINVRKVLSLFDDNGVVVVLAVNRIDKFTRENPKAIDFIKHYSAKIVKDSESLLSPEAKKMLKVSYTVYEWVNVLGANGIDDPAFAKAANFQKNRDALLNDYERNNALASALNMGYTLKKADLRADDVSLLAPYPLLGQLRTYSANKEHVKMYINAAYAARKDKS